MPELPNVSRKEEVILRVLKRDGELYGLQIVMASDSAVSRGTVYTTLNRMVEKGLVGDREEAKARSRGGMARRLYRISRSGRRMLDALDARHAAWGQPALLGQT